MVDLLRRRSAEFPENTYIELLDGETAEVKISFRELDNRARAIAASLQAIAPVGERALLLFPPGLGYITAFFGCLYAGIIAVPVFPPRPNQGLNRLREIAVNARATMALTTASILSMTDTMLEYAPELKSLKWIASDAIETGIEDNWRAPSIDERSLAFLQYTSGSTRTPRGVRVTHGNLLNNEQLIQAGVGSGPDTVMVSWLPLYHDMGLIGTTMQPLFVGGNAVIMSPTHFLQKPLRWLQAVSRYRGTISGGPNFGYDLCVQRVRAEDKASLDLSSWRAAFSGAEPVRADTLERFAAAFKECGFRREFFFPCYGLAEATLFVSGGPVVDPPVVSQFDRKALEQHQVVAASATGPDTASLVGCGKVWGDMRVAIVDPASAIERPAGQLGEIWIAGPSVADGYWEQPEETETTFRARLADTGEGPFLRTGDLGFMIEGELFITGRIKDLVIIRGANHYPQDIELTVESSHAALRRGCGAAFSVDQGSAERLVVVQEIDPRFKRSIAGSETEAYEAIFQSIRRALAEHNELEVSTLVLLKSGTIPKTSSGKIQRQLCKARFLAGELEVIATWQATATPRPATKDATPEPTPEPTPTQQPAVPGRAVSAHAIEVFLLTRLAAMMGIPSSSVDVRQPFSHYGLDSARLQALAGELGEWMEREIPATAVYEFPTIERLAAHLGAGSARAEREPSAPVQRASSATAEPIAIIGIGCRFPGANGPGAFWELLSQGVDAVGKVPSNRWDADALYDADSTAPGKVNTQRGGFLERVDEFDRRFFGINAHEAATMDPQQRLLLEVAWEALEDAGQVASQISGSRTGVFVGISANEYSKLQLSDPSLIDGYAGTGNALSIAANRLSYVWDLQGPSIAVDTACSSSLVAIHLACQSLRAGDSTLALAGGVNLVLTPSMSIAFTKAGMLSPDGVCRSFDAGANGYVRGEGCGVVVLKPLSKALADGDPIYAVILGTAVNQDGRSNGLTAPNPLSQMAVLRDAYRGAGVLPRQIDYVETHGTGTLLGDPIEARALGVVLSEGRSPDQPCLIGSVKTNIGHLESAAGIAGLIKVALSLKHRAIPQSLHFEKPNPMISFGELRLRVATELTPWPSTRAQPLAGVSSFGFGGTNAHAVLAAPVPTPQTAVDAAPTDEPWLLPISAKSPGTLRAMAEAWTRSLSSLAQSSSPGASRLSDMVRTAAVRREHHACRLAVRGSSAAALADELQSFLAGQGSRQLHASPETAVDRQKIAFVFSGQGAQWAGMGRDLIEREPVFRDALEACDRALRRHVTFSVIEELSATPGRLDQTEFAQPAIFALQVALAALFQSWGIKPYAVVGHSVGEVAAAHVAGALSLEDAARVVVLRSRSMEGTAGQGKMLRVPLSAEAVKRFLAGREGRVSVAAINSSTSTVLSGEAAALAAIASAIEETGLVCQWLHVNYAFHSPQMDPCRVELEKNLRGLVPRGVTIPFISTVTGQKSDGEALDDAYWGRNIREPVRFADAVERLLELGCTTFVELAGHPVLSREIQAEGRRLGRDDVTTVLSLRREEAGPAALHSSLGALYASGCSVQWDAVYPFAGPCVALPSYAWDHERFWLETAHQQVKPQPTGRHPFLGEHLDLASGTHLFRTQISASLLPYLQDHRVRGAVVLPAAVYVEMALAAAEQAGVQKGMLLQELSFDEALVLLDADVRSIQIAVEPAADGAVNIAIHSRPGGQDESRGAWTLHAKGRLVPDAGLNRRSEEPFSLGMVQIRCLEQVPPAQFYKLLQMRGLQYGPAFRGVVEVWRQEGESLAKLSRPRVLGAEPGPYALHPAILDAALQALAATSSELLAEDNSSLFLPIGVEHVVLENPGRSIAWSHAVARTGADGDAGYLVGDVRLLDGTGETVAELRGFRLQRIGRGVRDIRDARRHEWLYEIAWKQLDEVKPPAEPHVQKPGRWLLFTDSSGVGARLAARLTEAGQQCVTVAHTDGGTADFHVDPADEAGMERLIREQLGVGKEPVQGVVHLWSLDATGVDETSLASLKADQIRGARSVVSLVRALALAASSSPRLWLVTQGGQAVQEERVSAVQATVWGLAKSIVFEHPDLKCTRVDLDVAAGPDAHAPLAELLLNEFGEDQIAVRGGDRYVPRVLPYVPRTCEVRERARQSGESAALLHPDATYLVTGGTGGLGLAVARWMVSQGARHLVLVGRSGASARSEPVVQALRAGGADIVVAAADVANADQLASVLSEIDPARPLRGVVHSAGIIDDVPLLQMSREQLLNVMSPKVQGAWNLHALTAGATLDFFVLFSSVVSVVGSPGQANYGAANAFLDALAHERRARGLPALSINWGPWAEVGLAAELLESSKASEFVTARLLNLIRPEDGIRTLEQLMRDEDAGQISVLAYDLKNLVQFYPVGPGIAFFTDLLGEELGTLRSVGSSGRVTKRPKLRNDFVAPRDDIERVIANLWQRALEIEQIGINDAFFELGGDSVFAGQIVAQINKSFDVAIPLKSAIESFTIASLADLVRQALITKLEDMDDAEAERLLSVAE